MAELKDIKDSTPNKDLINHLEVMLAEAKSGEIRSIIYLVEWNDRNTSNSWTIDERTARKTLLAELTLLHHDFTVSLEFADKTSMFCKALSNDE